MSNSSFSSEMDDTVQIFVQPLQANKKLHFKFKNKCMMKPINSILSKTSGLTLSLLLIITITTYAQTCLESNNFSSPVTTGAIQAPGIWYTDRYAPNGFSSPSGDVGGSTLKQHIDAADGLSNRPGGFNSFFYNTQGRKYDLNTGTNHMEISLYIPSAWATSNKRMAGFWGTALDVLNGVSAFPIVEFTSDGGIPRFRGWENNPGSWVDMGLPTGFSYNSWVKLSITLLPSGEFEYKVGDLEMVTTTSGPDASIQIANVILQGHNYDPGDDGTTGLPGLGVTYNIYWDNFCAGHRALYVNDNSVTGDVYTSAIGSNSNPGTSAAPYATIGYAISQATAGDIIYVDAGTYAGSTGPDKQLTFLGANAAISPNTGIRVAESILTDPQAFRPSTTSRVIIKGFKLTTTAGNPIDNYTTGAKITLEKNLFDGSIGLFFANPDSLDVIDNRFKDIVIEQEGLFVAGNYNGTTGSYVDVHDNTWVNGQATGMNLSNVKGILYHNNFTNIAYYGVLVANLCNLDIYENVFSGITNPGLGSPTWGAGVRFYTPAPGLITTVRNNYFTNNYVGVGVRNVGGDGSLAGTTVTINNNSFSGNTDKNIKNQAAQTLNATCNWLGSNVPATVAATIDGPVTYAPYLLNGTDNQLSTPGFQPAPGSCSGGIPKLKTSINGVIVNANNDGNDDNGSFAVCNTANNILFNSFTDQNGLSDPLLRVYQTYTTNNVTVPFCNNCWATMAAFAGVTGTAALINPALPGVLTIRFRSWVDTDNDQTIDPSELASDWIEYTITVKASPAITPPTVTQPTCATPTGKIVVNATGSGTLEYSINGGTSWSASNTFNSLAPGNYIVAVRLQSSPYCSANYGSNPVVLAAATGCPVCTITCPANITVNSTSGKCGKYVTYPAATKTGSCGTGSLSYSLPSGAWFTVGTTIVTVTLPSAGASCAFSVTVVDNQKPDINCPSNIVVNAANNSCSKVVNYSVSVTDNCPGAITVTSVPASGSVFNTGTTTVVVTATDAAGNISTSSFTVTVKETKPPVITCPVNITVNAEAGLCKAMVDPGTATATDNCPGVITITGKRSDNKALNAYYPLGVTTITWKAKDASGNESTCQQKITVKDIQPPAITNVSVNPAVLWPADHSMKNVTVNYTSTDNCGPDDNCSSGVCYLSVTSNEPISGTGNGDLSPDWQIIDAHKVKLRAERNPNGAGRIYTIKITCTDAAGNSSVQTITVIVPLTAPPASRTMAPSEETYTIAEKEISTGLTAQLMPNPAEREFNLVVKGGNHETLEIRVFDITGREVQRIRNAANHVIRFGSNLMQGTYIVEIRQGKEKVVLKAIKQ